MGHEATKSQYLLLQTCIASKAHFVILSSIDRGSNMKVGSETRLRSAPGRSWDMMWVSTANCHVSDLGVAGEAGGVLLLPWSASTTVSSSFVTSSPLVESVDDRLPTTQHQHIFTFEGAANKAKLDRNQRKRLTCQRMPPVSVAQDHDGCGCCTKSQKRRAKYVGEQRGML